MPGCGNYKVEAGGDARRGKEMRTSPTDSLIDHLRRAVLLPDGVGLGDGELLERFIERHDEAAFAVLVNRHGPMVWGVCRRLLHEHDAEDAFQATFLVLARKAASIRSKGMVGNWLYGVAHQTALQVRRTAARRRAKEVQVTKMPDIKALEPGPWADIQPLLDEELTRLPEIYRAVIVLCDLEGRTRKKVASHLGVPEGTVAARMARARAMLAKRLTQRGVTLSGGALAAVLAQQAASAGVPKSVVVSTIKAVSLLAAGKAAATGVVSVKVAALTEGVMKAMLFNKLKWPIAVVLILGFMATGAATLMTNRTAAGQDDKKPTAEKLVEPAKQQKEKEPFTAWGKEVGGLHAGLGLRPGDKRVYSYGDIITLVVRVRNASKKTVQFKYVREFLDENYPTVASADGKTIPQEPFAVTGVLRPIDVILEPGKEVKLDSRFDARQYELVPNEDTPGSKNLPVLIVPTGKVSLQYSHVFGYTSSGSMELDRKLGTGKLELDVKDREKKPKG
jgi:RNA polymerase sigma factor (sigma-70 family)